MYYSCKQMKAKMLVAHTEPVLVDDSYDWRVRAVRSVKYHEKVGLSYDHLFTSA